MKLSGYVKHYALEHDIKASTKEQLTIAVRLFERWAGPLDLSEVTAERINEWLVLLAERNLSTATIASKRQAILTLVRAAAEEGLAPFPARVRRIKRGRRPPCAWSVEEVRLLLRAANGDKFWDPFIRVCWDTGLRLSDVLSLRTGDIRLVDGLICITQQKTGWMHLCRIRPSTVKAVEKRFSKPNQAIFAWPGCRRKFFAKFAKLVAASGIRPGTTKWLRRASSTAVEAMQAGAAMAHLGHRTPGLAYQHYVDPTLLGINRPQPPEL